MSHHPPSKRPSDREYPNDLICNTKFRNTLPEVPFDPKLLKVPLDPHRFVNYSVNGLQAFRNFEYFPTEPAYVPMELIDNELYSESLGNAVSKADSDILEEIDQVNKTEERRKAVMSTSVSFLKKTGVLSNAYRRFGYTDPSKKVKPDQDSLFNQLSSAQLSTDEILRRIEATFVESASQHSMQPTFTHPTKPNLTVERVVPFLPHKDLAPHSLAHVVFNELPLINANNNNSSELISISNSVLLGEHDAETGDNYVSYHVPIDKTELLSSVHKDGDVVLSTKVGDYSWQVKTVATESANSEFKDVYLITKDRDAYYFKKIETNINLKLRKPSHSVATEEQQGQRYPLPADIAKIIFTKSD